MAITTATITAAATDKSLQLINKKGGPKAALFFSVNFSANSVPSASSA
jgi:hypothetical protein